MLSDSQNTDHKNKKKTRATRQNATKVDSLLNVWNRHWQQLTQPSNQIKKEEFQWQARLSSALSFALFIVALLIAPIWIVANPDFSAAIPISAGIVMALGCAYGLSRSRYYRLGTYILVAMLPGCVVAVILTAPGSMIERMLALNFLVVSILLSSILLSKTETIIFALVILLGICVFFLIPEVRFAITYSYLVYIATMSALFVVTSIIRNYYVNRLQRSERRYRSLFEQSNDAVFILDLHGFHIHVNQRATDLLGYTVDELLSLSYKDVIIPEQVSKSDKALHRLIQGELLPIYERIFQCKDGSQIHVEVNVELVRDEAGTPLHIQSVVRDITERRQQEEQIRLQSTALEATANAVVITDIDGIIQWVNPAFSHLTGYDLHEALGKNTGDLVRSGEHDEIFYQHLWDSIHDGQIWQGEIINQRKNGIIYTEEQTITPVKNHNGDITYFVAIKEDITEKKTMVAK